MQPKTQLNVYRLPSNIESFYIKAFGLEWLHSYESIFVNKSLKMHVVNAVKEVLSTLCHFH